ncbi:MAG: ACT domain-containing protein, partial [Rikenellaceae bacterium]|nr:ACT domain-containing protein [Rikenellaceae bacterium]
ISVFFVSQASSENTTSIGVKNDDADMAIQVLEEEFASEIKLGEINRMKKECNLATVAIVGENMKRTPGMAGKLFGTLGRNGINVIACAQGASETNISFVITLESLRKALNVIHDSFFLSDYQVLNVFVAGVGLVGSNLLEQIHKQKEKLQNTNSLKINIVGITNSKKYITCRERIDMNNYKELLAASENVSTPESFRDEIIGMNIFNSVFVDCTASPQVASIYKDLLQHNVSVVTANKVAASSEYALYSDLKNTSRKRGVKFLFETNVGAGLPIINTIGDLINSGDHILKIEAVVSGTLNYIFNVMSQEVPLSRAIRMAMDAGYAEPDPRIDLSGMDVLRKLVILSREAGYKLEQEDVKKNLFVPQEYFDGSIEDFWTNVTRLDAPFEARRKQLEAEGKRLRFVARLEEGQAEIGLQEVDANSPFYHLEGSNNVILLTTERYNKYPLQIKGYGAGASVTAAGVFADMISIANIR